MLRIEAPRRLILGVHEKRANTGVFGNSDGAQDGIAQETAANPPLLIVPVNGKPRKYHHGNGVPSQALLCA